MNTNANPILTLLCAIFSEYTGLRASVTAPNAAGAFSIENGSCIPFVPVLSVAPDGTLSVDHCGAPLAPAFLKLQAFASGFNAETTVYVPIIQGEFPRYTAVLPAACEGRAEDLDVKALLHGLAVASSVLPPENQAVVIEPRESELVLTGKHKGAESFCKIPSAPIFGDEDSRKAFALNPEYLADACKAAGTEAVELRWTDPQCPVEIRAEGFRGVVMPITIQAALNRG